MTDLHNPHRYAFAWHCVSPPEDLEALATEQTDYGVVDYITERAVEVDPDDFAAAVGGWPEVTAHYWGGWRSEGVEADAAFLRADDHIGWYRSTLPDGRTCVFHTASGIEHVYHVRPTIPRGTFWGPDKKSRPPAVISRGFGPSR